MPRPLIILAALLCTCLLSACAQYDNKRGVDVNWQSSVTDQLVKGESTRYDRAIFFFDEDDVLTEYSTRIYESDTS